MENKYSYREIYKQSRESNLTITDYEHMKNLALTMPIENLLSFVEQRFIYGLINNQNEMILTFMFLNVVVEKRFDVNFENFKNIIKFIDSVTTYSEPEQARLKVMKCKLIDDILVPLYARALKQSPIAIELSKALYECILNFLPATEYSMDDIDDKLEVKLSISASLYEVPVLQPFDNFREKLKDEEDEAFTREYLFKHPNTIAA
ncbi:MAG: hypothetical protein ABIM99_00455 [Candidatus Dojkabacteria bacterium]